MRTLGHFTRDLIQCKVRDDGIRNGHTRTSTMIRGTRSQRKILFMSVISITETPEKKSQFILLHIFVRRCHYFET